MNKFAAMILAGAVCASLSFGADFSKQSNEELIKMAGTVAPADAPDYKIEIHKRMKTMKKEEAKKFHEQLEEAMQKNTDSMTLKEFRERREAIKQAMDAKIKTMSKKELKESGLDRKFNKCGMHHDHDKKHADQGKKQPEPKGK
ncbi:hypothetical protein BKH46_07945 [Helicobacter sp. 12S02634-8]|uniref:DUF1104 domain-containing protein n=1 Tax=Helicobacter sp. 12S02634-8 TaxID=1476199 RepID=UPI000BA724D0|nr:DUF1104 domain-containing protein [Helicobacter sp. 12S02634-8]PAF46390.1 hypothetical protein BKH46_07945 [Helicobacter sp. 12S02634-8]